MIQSKIVATFPKCVENTCLETVNYVRFWINDPTDNQSKCEIVTEENPNNHFEIENFAEKKIHFLAIDKCIFQDSDEHKKCDFAVFDEMSFCWVEVKDVKPRNRKNSRKMAIEQLKRTIEIFKKNIDFGKIKLEANVCFHSKISTRPQFSATNAAIVKEFQDEFRVRLTEGNKKIF